MSETTQQFVHMAMPDGIHHVSRDIAFFRQLQEANGRHYTDATTLIDDYRKYLRMMEHFDGFEWKVDMDLVGAYPTYPILARILNQSKAIPDICFKGKPIPYRVLEVSVTESGEQEFTLANHQNKFFAKELEFFIKTRQGLIKLH